MKHLPYLFSLLLCSITVFGQDPFNDLRNNEKKRNRQTPVRSSSQPLSLSSEMTHLPNAERDFLKYLLKNDVAERNRVLKVHNDFVETASSTALEYKKKYAAHNFKRTGESRELIIHQDSIASRITFLSDSLIERTRSLRRAIGGVQKNIEQIEPSQDLDNYRKVEAAILAELKTIQVEKDAIEKTLEKLSAGEKEYLKKGADEGQKRKTISSLPQISDVLGGSGAVTPSLNLLGAQDFKKGTFRGGINVFASAVSKDRKYDWRSLVIREQSDFGIVMDIFKGFWVDKAKDKFADFGLRGSLGYLMKPGFKIDQNDPAAFQDFSYGIIQYSVGCEYLVFSNILTLHADYSGFNIITHLRDVHDNMPELYENRHKPSMGYYSAGARFRINPSGFGIDNLATSYLVLDLNFSFVNGFLSRMADPAYTQAAKTPVDKVVPVIRVSLKI